MPSIRQAIDDFYAAFADVPTPHHIDGCPCCIDRKLIPLLLSTPLRSISPNDLSSYASSAFLTVGDVADYLYFLPRIMEISISDDSWWPDVAITARAIRSSGFSEWPNNRRAALLALLNATVCDLLQSKRYWEIDDWLCAVGRLGVEVSPFLRMIEMDSEAVLQLFERNQSGLKRGKLSNPFWERPNDGHEIIIQWFKSDSIRAIVFDAWGYTM